MAEMRVNIGQVRRDISELVNRVAYGGERVILTSRGKPKAALVSIEDYQRLQQGDEAQAREARLKAWQDWAAKSDRLNQQIVERRGGRPIDVDALWRATREEIEARDDWVIDYLHRGSGCESGS